MLLNNNKRTGIYTTNYQAKNIIHNNNNNNNSSSNNNSYNSN